MNFTIDRDILLEKLNIIAHGLPTKTPMKIFECIKIEATDEDLFLASSNSDISIEVLVKDSSLSIQEKGLVAVPGKVFIDLIKAFDSKKITIFLIENKALMLKADRKEYMINIMDVEDYPPLKFDTSVKPFYLNCKALKQAIEETVFACSSVNKNPMLQGVNFRLENNTLVVTATNSYRLSQKIITVNTEDSFNVTIPAKSLVELEKCLEAYEENEDLEIYISNNVTFKFNNVLFLSCLLDGNYPNTSSLFPKNPPIIVRFNKEELLTAVNRISILSPIDNKTEKEITYNAIRLKIDQTNEVELSSANNQGAGKELIIPTGMETNSPLIIGFSSKYLTEALRVIPSNEVEIAFENSMRQFTIRAVNNKALTELILPFRLEN